MLLGGIIIFAIAALLFSPRYKPIFLTELPKQQTNSMQSGSPTKAQTGDPQSRLIERVKNRQPLSQSDLAAKDYILSRLKVGSKSGQLYTSETVHIEYISSADLFQAEIMTNNVEKAKLEAVQWFKDQGFSQDAICNYPVSFYLNYEIKLSLDESAETFNPLPPDCG